MRRDYLAAALLEHWPAFYSWLIQTGRVPEIPGVAETAIDATPSFCPIHGGASGEAFHFYLDADQTGGAVCNTCGSFSDGLAMLDMLTGQPDQVNQWVDDFMLTSGLSMPHPEVLKRLSTWLSAHDPQVAINYLRNRGLSVTQRNLPPAIRGLRSFEVWDREANSNNFVNRGKMPAMLSLQRDANGAPVTFQYIALTKLGQKAQGLTNVKRTAGVNGSVSLAGSFVEIGSARNEVMVLAEGVETSLALRELFALTKEYPCIRATLGGAGVVHNQVIPDFVRKVILGVDYDAIEHALDSAEDLRSRGLDVILAPASLPGNPKADWLDVLKAFGLTKARAQMDASMKPAHDFVRAAKPLANKEARDKKDTKFSRKPIEVNQSLDAFFAAVDGALAKQKPKSWRMLGDRPIALAEVGWRELTDESALSDLGQTLSFTSEGVPARTSPLDKLKQWWHRSDTYAKLQATLPRIEGVIAHPGVVGTSADRDKLRLIALSGVHPDTSWLTTFSEEEAKRFKAGMITEPGLTLKELRIRAYQALALIDKDIFDDLVISDRDRAFCLAALLTPMVAAACESVPLLVLNPAPRLADVLSTVWEAPKVRVTADSNSLRQTLQSALGQTSAVLRVTHSHLVDQAVLAEEVLRLPQVMMLYAGGYKAPVSLPAEVSNRVIEIKLNKDVRSTLQPKVFLEAEKLRIALYSILSAWYTAGAPVWDIHPQVPGCPRWNRLVYAMLMFASHPATKYLGSR